MKHILRAHVKKKCKKKKKKKRKERKKERKRNIFCFAENKKNVGGGRGTF